MSQQVFDFTRGDQLGLLRAVRFTDLDGVSGTATKAVLKAIDDHGRECCAGVETLAASANVSQRVAKRALARLVRQSLITRTVQWNATYRRVLGHCRIVWTELDLFVTRNTESQAPVPATQPPSSEGPRLRTNGPLEQSNGPPRPTNGPLATERSAIMTPNPIGTVKKPPPTGARAGGRLDLEVLFRDIGLKHYRSLAVEFCEVDQSEIESAAEVYRLNITKFAGPGAVIEFLRSGCWPVDGVLSIEEAARVQESRRQREQSVAAERARCAEAKNRPAEPLTAAERQLLESAGIRF